MNKPLLLLSTCGTSVLTNGAGDEMRRWLNQFTNHRILEGADADRLEEHVAERRELLRNASPLAQRKLSAELNGIGAVLQRWPASRVQHHLVHTDTAIGRAAAALVREALEADAGGHKAQSLTAPGLRTDSMESFRAALSDLTHDLEALVSASRQQGEQTIFNMTGGFKALNAYLQALGMLLDADRCVFLFEGAPELMEIPRLPVQLSAEDEIRRHSGFFRRAGLGYKIQPDEAAGVSEALVLSFDGTVRTNVWGEAIWSRFRKQLLGEALLEPLSAKLTLSPAVRKAVANLSAERRIEVNEALDHLSAYLDLGRQLPLSNTFKQLQGKPVPGSTHEMYLWSDGAARRLFGHYEQGCFVADMIGPHL